MTRAAEQMVADAPRRNWVDVWAPAATRPWLRLMRADRPIGTWLLLLPCWMAQALAAAAEGRTPSLWLAALFAVGAIVMRGAGCVVNDIADRDIDARVARTRSRPLPSGQVTLFGAFVFAAALMLIGLGVLVQLDGTTALIGLASVPLIVIYPFMKRITWWPQAFLGLTFNWGMLVGWSAETGGGLAAPALLLYAGAVAWTLGYDTIYAHQDKLDDAQVGVKSSALRLGAATPRALIGFYAVATLLWGAAVAVSGAGAGAWLGPLAAAGHFALQINRLDVDDPARCLALFRANRDVGLLVACGFIIGALG